MFTFQAIVEQNLTYLNDKQLSGLQIFTQKEEVLPYQEAEYKILYIYYDLSNIRTNA